MKSRKILLVDDHAIVREGFARLILEDPDNEIVAQVDNGHSAIDYAALHDVDVALVDINMEGIDGLKTTEILKKTRPGIHVIILSVNEVEPFISKSFDAGADAFLSKRCAPEELKRATLAVCRGERYVSDDICRRMAIDKLNNTENLLTTLTSREFEVFRLLARGDTVNDIADDLNISPKTAYVFRGNILKKLNLSTLADIIYCAQRYQIV